MIEKITEMLKDSPQDSFLRHALALEYLKIDKMQEAHDAFVSLLADNPAYLGSYYHLGKLYEKMNEMEKANDTYQKGMEVAKQQADQHSLNELRMAADELE